MQSHLESRDQEIALSSVCQPIVSLVDDYLAGFVVRIRWPQLQNPTPGDVVVRALAAGWLNSLNRRCVESGLTAALAAGLPRSSMLVIKNEPGGRYQGLSDEAALVCERHNVRLVYELLDPNLLGRRRELLDTVAALRGDGIAVALGNLGEIDEPSELLDVVQPEVVTLSSSLVNVRPCGERERTIRAIRSLRGDTDVVVVAEGIETADQRRRALELGATLGLVANLGHRGSQVHSASRIAAVAR